MHKTTCSWFYLKADKNRSKDLFIVAVHVWFYIRQQCWPHKVALLVAWHLYPPAVQRALSTLQASEKLYKSKHICTTIMHSTCLQLGMLFNCSTSI